MKKIILAIALIIVLLSVFIGAVLVHAVGTTSSGPSLSATVMTSGLNAQGRNWGLGVHVGLYIDIQDDVHHVADVTPAGSGGSGGWGGTLSAMGWKGRCTGSFQVTIPLNGISVGPHTLIGVQDVTILSVGAQSSLQVIAPFTILVTPPVDNRIWGALTDPVTGLVEIKNEIIDIQNTVNNSDTGVLATNTEVGNIQNVSLDNAARVDTDSESQCWSKDNNQTVITTYEEGIRHVNLTIRACDLGGWLLKHDDVKIMVHFPSFEAQSQDGSSQWEQLDKITGNGMHTYQFDTDSWKIVGEMWSNTKSSFCCDWNVTTLEPQFEEEHLFSTTIVNSKIQKSFEPGPQPPEDTEVPTETPVP